MVQSSNLPNAASTLSEWLEWQESLNPAEIDLGLERIREVYARLQISQPPRVFTVAGTNGKGSCVAVMERVLRASGWRTGAYTSPHLLHYNERIAVAGKPAGDQAIIAAFVQVNTARKDVPLTYFEFGTLAALQYFHNVACDAWLLEVGLGGRLDAVNIIDADVAVITTVDIDHQQWLGDTVEQIAAEKAGILRTGKPAFYGDVPVPQSVLQKVAESAVELHWPGSGFSLEYVPGAAVWSWQGQDARLEQLPLPAGGRAQLANQALALAALEAGDRKSIATVAADPALLAECRLPGRMQHHSDEHEWLLDVAHNAQAARALREELGECRTATVVVGMLADKQAEDFARALDLPGAHWITCPASGVRAAPSADLAQRLMTVADRPPVACASVAEALLNAREITPSGGLIVVTGSFSVVGPALDWLGLY